MTAPPLSAALVTAIVRDVGQALGLAPAEICGDRRLPPLPRARAAVAWLARQTTDYSLSRIGRALGGRDHSTIIHQIGRAIEYRASSTAFRALTDGLVEAAAARAADCGLDVAGRRAAEQRRDRAGRILGPVRTAARARGYTIALIGGGKGAIGLAALPWAAEAVPAGELAALVRATAAQVLGRACDQIDDGQPPQPGPHGRLTWPIRLGGGAAIALSILPRLDPETTDAPASRH